MFDEAGGVAPAMPIDCHDTGSRDVGPARTDLAVDVGNGPFDGSHRRVPGAAEIAGPAVVHEPQEDVAGDLAAGSGAAAQEIEALATEIRHEMERQPACQLNGAQRRFGLGEEHHPCPMAVDGMLAVPSGAPADAAGPAG
jgi:hypothetical protein